MSENKHTPEPWVVEQNGFFKMAVKTESGLVITFEAGYGSELSGQEKEANARRIVACVNACAGISTETLESVADLGDTLSRRFSLFNREIYSLQSELNIATKQRGELLAALEKMNRAYVNLMENGRDRIIDLGGKCDPLDVMERSDLNLKESRAVIASEKGGAE